MKILIDIPEELFADIKAGIRNDDIYVNLIRAVKQAKKEKATFKYCDRNICKRNEYNGIGCEDCEVQKNDRTDN